MTLQEYSDIRDYLMEIFLDTEFFGKVYCVGGCVRDYVRGVPPKDIDLVVEIEGGGLMLASVLWKSGYLVSKPLEYRDFGVTKFRLSKFPEHEIEAVHTRLEDYFENSRNPKTEYGGIECDWKRRDFTINSLYQSLWLDKIFDPSGKGIEDIRMGIIRTTSDANTTFQEDPLRILRAIRFASCFGYKFDEECISGMCKNSNRLSLVSYERIESEVTKILTSENPKFGMETLGKTGCIKHVDPYLEAMIYLEQNKYHIGTVWEHTLEVIDKLKGQDKITLWAGLLHDIGKVTCKTIGDDGRVHFIGHAEVGANWAVDTLRYLGFSNQEIKEISELILHHMDFKNNLFPKDKKLRKLQHQLGRDQYLRLWNLIEADNMSHAPGYCIEGQRDYVLSRPMDMFDYKLPVTGYDVMEVRKIPGGPLVRKYLEHLLKLAYVNPELTKEDMLKRLRNLSPSKLGGKENE